MTLAADGVDASGRAQVPPGACSSRRAQNCYRHRLGVVGLGVGDSWLAFAAVFAPLIPRLEHPTRSSGRTSCSLHRRPICWNGRDRA
jgi:hypothetical protein